MNLREWTRVVFKELYYTENNQKIADKKKAEYQEGLEKSRADSAEQSRDSYMKDQEKSRAWSHKSYMKEPEKVVLTVQYEATKVTWRIRKRRADTAAWSHKICNKDLEKNG